MNAPFFVVDAFTDRPFRGNPAAVVVLDGPYPTDEVMQSVATEFRHSETAFLSPDGPGVWQLRWFTPTVEIDLCGHASLAATHVLGGTPVFLTRGGRLRGRVPSPGRVELDLPADPPAEIDEPDGLRAALGGADILGVGRGRYDLLVQVGSAEQVRTLVPDTGALGRLPFRGVVITAPDDAGAGVVTRCFYPAVGVPEDPASGSAHCTVGGWWFDRMGVDRLVARQLSHRTGTIVISRGAGHVQLSGNAVTVMWGRIPLPAQAPGNGEFT